MPFIPPARTSRCAPFDMSTERRPRSVLRPKMTQRNQLRNNQRSVEEVICLLFNRQTWQRNLKHKNWTDENGYENSLKTPIMESRSSPPLWKISLNVPESQEAKHHWVRGEERRGACWEQRTSFIVSTKITSVTWCSHFCSEISRLLSGILLQGWQEKVRVTSEWKEVNPWKQSQHFQGYKQGVIFTLLPLVWSPPLSESGSQTDGPLLGFLTDWKLCWF